MRKRIVALVLVALSAGCRVNGVTTAGMEKPYCPFSYFQTNGVSWGLPGSTQYRCTITDNQYVTYLNIEFYLNPQTGARTGHYQHDGANSFTQWETVINEATNVCEMIVKSGGSLHFRMQNPVVNERNEMTSFTLWFFQPGDGHGECTFEYGVLN